MEIKEKNFSVMLNLRIDEENSSCQVQCGLLEYNGNNFEVVKEQLDEEYAEVLYHSLRNLAQTIRNGGIKVRKITDDEKAPVEDVEDALKKAFGKDLIIGENGDIQIKVNPKRDN